MSLLNFHNRLCFLNHQSTFETSYSKDLILHAKRERENQKISLSGYKPRHKHKSIRKRLKIQNLRDPKIRVHFEQSQYSNRNRLYLSAPKLDHMTLVVKPLRLGKAREKRRTMHASNSLVRGKVNYCTDKEPVSSLGSAFTAINFLNFRRSFIVGK